MLRPKYTKIKLLAPWISNYNIVKNARHNANYNGRDGIGNTDENIVGYWDIVDQNI